MFRLTTCIAVAVAVTTSALSAVTYDLKTDWSDITNPFGTWSLRSGTMLLSHVTSNPAIDSFIPDQGGWKAASGTIPFWFKSTSTPSFTHDWNPNDIIVHTQDNNNGAGNGPANVTWTSPYGGTINISGSTWEGRDKADLGGGFRSNRWTLTLNGNLLSTGVISGGDPYSSANPFNFANGSGGTSALSNLAVAAGDIVMLQFVKLGVEGDYVGMNFTIVQVPEPGTRALVLLGGGTLATIRCRNQRR